jgi:hypothetical protein
MNRAGFVLTLATLISGAGPAHAQVIDDFESDAPTPWTFSEGAEFPGAQGALAAGEGYAGQGAALSFDFTGGDLNFTLREADGPVYLYYGRASPQGTAGAGGAGGREAGTSPAGTAGTSGGDGGGAAASRGATTGASEESAGDSESGCGCRVRRSPPGRHAALLLCSALALLSRRKRRR